MPKKSVRDICSDDSSNEESFSKYDFNKTSKHKKNSTVNNKKNRSKSRKDKKKITVVHESSSESSEHDTDDSDKQKFDEIKKMMLENYAQQKDLMNKMRVLLENSEKKVECKTKVERKTDIFFVNFNKLEPVPQQFKNLLEIEDDNMNVLQLTKMVYKYFQDNKMVDAKTREIKPNNKIKKIFKMKDKDVINFYNLQSWIRSVYDNENN